MIKKIILSSDHAGFKLKEAIKKFLIKEGFEVNDLGTHAYNTDDDYPEFIAAAAKNVASSKDSKGIVFGGSGQGEAIVANKIKGIRAVIYYGHNLDIVKLSRTHNDTNILSLGARFLTEKQAIEAVKLWLKTEFNNEERHKRRIKQITQIEKTCK
jgi:ribose 5-phosphate isomerase B